MGCNIAEEVAIYYFMPALHVTDELNPIFFENAEYVLEFSGSGLFQIPINERQRGLRLLP